MSIFGKLVSAIFGSSHAAEPAPTSWSPSAPKPASPAAPSPSSPAAPTSSPPAAAPAARPPGGDRKADVASRARSPDQEERVGAERGLELAGVDRRPDEAVQAR